jgi:hypothetical protein
MWGYRAANRAVLARSRRILPRVFGADSTDALSAPAERAALRVPRRDEHSVERVICIAAGHHARHERAAHQRR